MNADGQEARSGDAAWHVLRGTTLLAASRILDRASTFVIMILITPRFGASGVGTYSVAMALYQLFAVAGTAGTTSFIQREVSRDRTQTADYIVHLSVMAAAAAVVLLGIMELVVPHLGYSPALETSAAIALLAVPATVLNSVQEAAFLVHRRMEFETVATFINALLYIGVGAALLFTHHPVSSVIVAYVILEYIVTIVYFVLISRFIARLRIAFKRSVAWRMVRDMKAFTASSLLQALFLRPEIVILSLVAHASQVGYYSAAIRVAEIPEFLPELFMANVFTLMSGAFGVDEQRFRELQDRAARAILLFCLAVAAIIFGAAPGIITLLFGSRFHPAINILRILSLTVLTLGLMSLFWRTLSARGRQDAVLRIQIYTIGVKIATGFALSAPFAAVGAAISATVSSALQAALLVLAAARNQARPAVGGVLWRLILAGVVTAVLTAVLVSTSVWLAIPVGVVTYIAAVVGLRAVSAEDRELLVRLGQRATKRLVSR
jgi:polysaccharide transporter, PST family